jgi:hypothetical protein
MLLDSYTTGNTKWNFITIANFYIKRKTNKGLINQNFVCNAFFVIIMEILNCMIKILNRYFK